MRKHITFLMLLSLLGTGIAHAQCVTYSVGYAMYSSFALDNTTGGSAGVAPGSGTVTITGYEQSTQVCHRWLAGGDCQQWLTEYDSGTVSITVDGFTESVSYGQGSTTSSIAAALASAFNGATGSPVTASASGAVVTLTANETDNTIGTTYAFSATSSTNFLSTYGAPSFAPSTSGITLSGTSPTNVGSGAFTSVLIDGSTSMTVTESSSCPYPEYENILNELPTATHTPSVGNAINGLGGVITGTPVCVTCYSSEQSTLDSGDLIVGTQYPFEASAEVICSVGGTIFTTTSWSFLEDAYTQDKFLNTKVNCTTSNKTGITYCDYLVAAYCTPATTPPDLNPTAVEGSSLFADPYYYDVYGIGFRFTLSSPFIFLNIDSYAKEVYDFRAQATCTKNNP